MEQKDKDKIMDSITEVGHKKFLTSCARSGKETLTKTGLPFHWVASILSKLQAIYLHKWTSAIEGIEELVVTEWSQALAGLSGEQIKLGLNNLPEGWPPSAIDFRALCEGRNANGLGTDYKPPYHTAFKRDRAIESDENKEKHEAAYQSGISGLKNILNN